MATADRRLRLPVRVSEHVWREEVERFDERSPVRTLATRARARLERDGAALSQLEPCAALGNDGTRLGGLVKLYVPIDDGPASGRPFGFVLSPERDSEGPYLEFVAFGERHPRRGVRSVYERAHKRLHGRYPDQ